MNITWANNLRTTAGMCYSKFEDGEYISRIELAVKVVDNEKKLRETLLHELCHAAAWIVDHVKKPPHGSHFKYYADKAMKVTRQWLKNSQSIFI
jgi:predicted SprT family Zn-dependent metalloprotease